MVFAVVFVVSVFWGLIFFVFGEATHTSLLDRLLGPRQPIPLPHKQWFEVAHGGDAELRRERRYWVDEDRKDTEYFVQERLVVRSSGEVLAVLPEKRIRRVRSRRLVAQAPRS